MFGVTKRSLLIVALIVGVASLASASPITGSLSLSAFNVQLVPSGSNLATATSITATSAMVMANGLQNYSTIVAGTPYSITALNLSNFAGFTLGNASYGTFVAASGNIVQQEPDFLDIFLLGTYTPGTLNGGIGGFDPSAASLRLSYNQTAGSLSVAITLASPPNLPEPASIFLLGGGLMGIAFIARRKRA
jgi:hypothetical protein